jgi:hypothetical protein
LISVPASTVISSTYSGLRLKGLVGLIIENTIAFAKVIKEVNACDNILEIIDYRKINNRCVIIEDDTHVLLPSYAGY